MTRRLLLLIIATVVLLIVGVRFILVPSLDGGLTEEKYNSWWEIQSIDTVKYSRDLAREKAKDASFDEVIDQQLSLIAQTGATHVAVGTPYDAEFIPFMKRWIAAARHHGLSVWFRGNFAGWERWFDYKKISREEHTRLLQKFILSNGELFENGDVFSHCTECENGGPGDPRRTGDLDGHRRFLVEEHKVAKEAFRKIGKSVATNYNPMNGDVARALMDPETTKALGGIVVIDHYVKDPEQLSKDIAEIAERSGGRVVLGEFGAPIPGVHENLTESQQALWIDRAFTLISESEDLVGVNYWTAFGGSTRLWEGSGAARQVVDVLEKFYNPKILRGTVKNEIGRAVKNARVYLGPKMVGVGENGSFAIAYVNEDNQLIVQANGYKSFTKQKVDKQNIKIVLERENEGLVFKLLKLVYRLIR